MQNIEVIEVGEVPPTEAPHPALATIWPRAGAVLRHYAVLNTDEVRVREIQFGILRHGAFIVPSLYREGGDLCRSSYYFRHRVFYCFGEGDEAYFWVTSVLDRCYSLAVLYLPAHGLALSLYPYTADPNLLGSFEHMRAGINRPAAARDAPPATPLTAVGYFHIIHHLWNELPALDRAVTAGLAPYLQVVATYQPMGPLEGLFPELRGRVQIRTMAEAEALNASVAMFTQIGAWSIPASTQARVIREAGRHVTGALLAEQERFRARHGAIFWLSVKPPERTCADQAAALVSIIQGLHAAKPDAGFLLNGVSYPWDYDTNPDYHSWFRDLLQQASNRTAAIIDEFVALLPPSLLPSVRVVTDVSIMEEISWAGIASFYFCHGGSMQNKIGWLHHIPGVVHSNRSFIASAAGMIPPVEAHGTVDYLPADLVTDDDDANYTPLQLARKDQNYRFTSTEAVTAYILGSFVRQVSPAKCNTAAPLPPANSNPRPLEDAIPPYIDDDARVRMATRCPDCDAIPKVKDAGKVQMEGLTRVQIMHNGLRMVADGYCGAWMTRLIELCHGHHEAQEERMFHEVLRFMPPAASMVELGGYWSYYSLWFLQGSPQRQAVVLEPDPAHLALGRANAALNSLRPHFVAGLTGGTDADAAPFVSETLGRLELPCLTVPRLMADHGIDTLDILHCDTQGAELDVLRSCIDLFAAGRVRWIFVSTHAELISGDPLTHQRCLALLLDAGATIEAEHDVHESFSGDGLIVARFGPAPAGWSNITLSYNRYSDSLFRNPLYDLALARRSGLRPF